MKRAALLAMAVILIILQIGCGQNNHKINVISREAGSGTRDAFTELTGIKEDGKDNTLITSEITSSTFVVITSVAGDRNAIGYVSLGTLSDNVKAVSIDGVNPDVQNIKDGAYPLIRTFNMIDNGNPGELSKDFMTYITSAEGMRIIEEQGYVAISENAEGYKKHGDLEGRIVIAGSTSVAPLIDVMADEYEKLYPKVEIEIQQTGSGAGITSTLEGACDIGMSSRELKAEEAERGARSSVIALDGIVVIVNKENPTDDLSTEEIKEIFTGAREFWQ